MKNEETRRAKWLRRAQAAWCTVRKRCWRFWRCERVTCQLKALEEFHDELGKSALRQQELSEALKGTTEELARASERLFEAERRLDRLYQRTPEIVGETARRRENLKRLMLLAGMGDNPLWEAVLSYADEHARNEEQTALGPNLSDADRHYNAGRAASALDFSIALRDLRLKAEGEATKAKG